MAIFTKSQGQSIQYRPDFIPMSIVESLISFGGAANQKKYLDLFLSVPELQAILGTKAKAFSNMKVIAQDKNGDEATLPNIDVLTNPNPLQNWKEFIVQYYLLRAIYGNEFIHPVTGVSSKARINPAALWNLPPQNAKVLPVENNLIPFNMTKTEELIAGYEFQYDGRKITYGPDEVIHYNDNQVVFNEKAIRLGESKIRPLVQACENIRNAYEARGIMISTGALGILSNETTDGVGRMDITPDKDQLQKDFKEKYGKIREKWSVIITNANLRWQSMATDVGKLKVFEEVDHDFRAIANQFNFPPEVLQTDSTYENKTKALVQLYQEAIIPEADEFLLGLSDWMGLDVVLKSDFSHVAALQADKEKRSKSINWAANGLAKALESNLTDESTAQDEFKKYLS